MRAGLLSLPRAQVHNVADVVYDLVRLHGGTYARAERPLEVGRETLRKILERPGALSITRDTLEKLARAARENATVEQLLAGELNLGEAVKAAPAPPRPAKIHRARVARRAAPR